MPVKKRKPREEKEIHTLSSSDLDILTSRVASCNDKERWISKRGGIKLDWTHHDNYKEPVRETHTNKRRAVNPTKFMTTISKG